jgi:hypothetical protein
MNNQPVKIPYLKSKFYFCPICDIVSNKLDFLKNKYDIWSSKYY